MNLDIYDEKKIEAVKTITSMLAKSPLIPQSLRGKPADVFTILLMGRELGLEPMASLNNIHVIQGKPTMSAPMMIALVRRTYPDARIKIEVDEKAKVAKCTAARHQKDPDPYTSTWDMNRAQMMNLIGKDNWKKQPMTMLKWRAVSDAIRTVFSDVLIGCQYTPDEAQDIEVESDADRLYREQTTQEQRELGNPEWLFTGGKRMSERKALKDFTQDELEERLDELDRRRASKPLKNWEEDEAQSICIYLDSLSGNE